MHPRKKIASKRRQAASPVLRQVGITLDALGDLEQQANKLRNLIVAEVRGAAVEFDSPHQADDLLDAAALFVKAIGELEYDLAKIHKDSKQLGV